MSECARQSGPANIDYDAIIRLGEELQRPRATLIALAADNDPFYADQPSRRRGAEWFAGIWKQFRFGSGMHLRRVHYRLISHGKPIIGDDGAPYENTEVCWKNLRSAARDARYLGLVPIEDFIDRRNDRAIEFSFDTGKDATLSVSEPSTLFSRFSSELSVWLPRAAEFEFSLAAINQRYQVELWCEKSTVNDVLIPLAREYQLNVVAAKGEISLTHCHQLVERAKARGRPVRILYVSDFDPAGLSMPVACARKIEFIIRRGHLDFDVQVRPIALNHEQCVEYHLPRTPLKESERRTAAFEAKFGEGATELDALEALRPGELHRILEEEILRYRDTGLDGRIEEIGQAFRDQLDGAREEILDRHADELRKIKSDYGDLVRRVNPEFKKIADSYGESFREIVNRFNDLQQTIAAELEEEAPDPADADWPEPADGDEDGDPLFDSTRDYVEQIDRFKQHQGKPTDRLERRRPNGGRR